MAAAKKKKSHSGKIILILIVLMAVGLAGYGYFSQSSELRHDDAHAAESVTPLDPVDPLFIAKPQDIVVGNATAPVTIIEYASLSCPHCAHFTLEELPKIKTALIDNGQAKLAFRHFPLNEPALRAAQLVECAGPNREALLKTLFAKQKEWAFEETFREKLKTISAENGIDAAAFDSCLADKEGENALLATRQEAATRAHVTSTPTFFINGVMLDGTPSADNLKKAVENAQKPGEKAAE